MSSFGPTNPAAAVVRTLLAVFGVALVAGGARLALAQASSDQPQTQTQTPAPAEPEPTQKLQKIEVTGSNIKRIEGETALPVQVITAEDIEREGVTTAADLLLRISSNSSAGAYPSANAFSDSGRQGFTGASLRGLGANKTLILINGRRVADYAFDASGESGGVDLNSIPLAAIKRVEILKDGASAIYGSDAIGGVINFIMRDDYQGAQALAQYGETQHGGGGFKRASVSAGGGDLAKDKFNVFITGNYQADQSLFGEDRAFAHTSYIPNQGIDYTSGNSSPANVLLPGVGAASPNYPQCAPRLSFPTIDAPNECRYDPNPVLGLLPQDERTQFFGRASYQITPDNQLFFEGGYSDNRAIFIEQPVPISSATTYGALPVIINPSSPYYPFGLVAEAGLTPQPLQVFWRANELGLRSNTTTSTQSRFILGSKGTLGDWDYDSAFNFNESRAVDHLNGGYASQAYELPILNSGIVNFFGPNTAQVTGMLQGGLLNIDDRWGTSIVSGWDGHVSKELFHLPAGPASLAFGGEVRKETLAQNSSPELISGDILGFGTSTPSESASRDVYSLFAELSFPIIKKFEADLAVRTDHYSDFGTTTNPKVSLRWEPAKWVLFRSSYGTGFHAPDLSELYSPQVSTNTPLGLSDPLRCPYTGSIFDCNTQFTSIQGGNPDLKPETSEGYTFGFVLEPVESLSIAVDWFKINIGNQIGALPAAFILSDLSQFGQYVTRGPADPTVPTGAGPITGILQYEVNLGDTHIAGADIDMRYRYRFPSIGTFNFTLTGTTYHTYDIENLDGSFFNQVGQSAAEGAIPRWSHFATVTWSQGPWDWTVSQLYQMGYYDANADINGNARRVGSYEIYDTVIAYSGIKNFKLSFGVHNVFDRAPPFSNQDAVFQTGYDPSYGDPRLREFIFTGEYFFR